MHRIEGDGEVVANQVSDAVKVEKLLHQRYVVINAVDDINLHAADRMPSWLV
ncbi:MAG: Uncharacterised protein [Prochlorococcus marinus str. MIT 9215]|nr:MAG: Uncharacterised protein [Prochlorococcus marinus str. MIT 9215]